MGTRDRYYVEDYYEIVSIIQILLNIKNKNIFYWGSSAGGTASIALSTYHEGTTAIANNPQTNILTDSPRRRNAIFNNEFHYMDKEEIIEKYYHRLTLATLMKHKQYVPRLFFIQNIIHEPDVRKNLNPFKDELETSNLNLKNITYWFYHDKDLGHAPLGLEKSLEYLHTIMQFENF